VGAHQEDDRRDHAGKDRCGVAYASI
jgi:hypothetical protein